VGSLEIIDAESVRQIVRLRECCQRHQAYHDTRGSSIARILKLVLPITNK
jgi:hypothetical protein